MVLGLTVAKILELAVGEFIKTGVGKLTEGAIEKSGQLWGKIKNRLQGEPVVEAAIVEVEAGSQEAVKQIEPFLQVAMVKDPIFAEEIQNIAQQINNEINLNQANVSMNQNISDQGKGYQIKAEKIDRVGDDYNTI